MTHSAFGSTTCATVTGDPTGLSVSDPRRQPADTQGVSITGPRNRFGQRGSGARSEGQILRANGGVLSATRSCSPLC